MTILAVDDDPLTFALTPVIAANIGFLQVDAVVPQADANRAFERPLLNIIEPGKDGVDLPASVRTIPAHLQVPPIVLTAKDDKTFTPLGSIESDITERKRAEEALRESEERFRLVSNASNCVIWDYDFNTETSWFNDNLEKLYGYASVKEGSRRFDWQEHIHPDDAERVKARLKAVVAGTDMKWQDEYRIFKANGQTAMVKGSVWLVRDTSGKALRMLGSFEDVTEEPGAADRKRQSLKLEAIGQMACGLAHDFNNLLTVILGNSDHLVESLTNEKQLELAKLTVGAAERAAGLSRRLLAFARKEPLEPKQVNVDDLIRSVHNVLKCAVSGRIVIRHIGTDGLWQTELDANQFEVALLNIAINARDAMPDGGLLTIRTSNLEIDRPIPNAQTEVPPGQYVKVSLIDTGTGMSPETMGRLFEPFFSTKKPGLGSGLGLSMVHGFVAQSGGYIQLISAPGKGTTCNLYFPRSVAMTSA